jgi:hypothetical protein
MQGQVTTKPDLSIDSLDTKLNKQWDSGKWSDASVGMMKAIWNGIKAKNEKGQAAKEAAQVGSLGIPNPDDLGVYVGQFGLKNAPQRELLEVTQADGKFSVKLQGHTIPAIIWNKSILFTTGDVVQSPTPALGGKPHGALELMAISSINGKYYFVSFASLGPVVELAKQ